MKKNKHIKTPHKNAENSSEILLCEGTAFVLPALLIQHVGLEETLVLQQVHYWLNPKRNQNIFDGRHWVHNTYAQWHQQFSFWSLKKIQGLFRSLEKTGFLISFTKCIQLQKTKDYTLNYESLAMIACESQRHKECSSKNEHISEIQAHNFFNPSSQNWVVNHPESVPSERTDLSKCQEPFCEGASSQSLDFQREDILGVIGESDLSTCSHQGQIWGDEYPKIGTSEHPKSVLSYYPVQ